MPLIALKLGLSPPGRSVLIRIIHRGTVATSNADRLDGINCAAQTTPPLPPTRRKIPITAALRHWMSVGVGSPAARRHRYKKTPEIMKRAAVIRSEERRVGKECRSR